MKTIALILFVSAPFLCYTQEEMETDRPDQTECASVVRPGRIQVETGFIYSKDQTSDFSMDSKSTIFNYGTTLIRVGVFKAAELRLEIGEYEKTNLNLNKVESIIEGFKPLVIGTKIAVCDEQGIRPKIAFIGHLELPIGDKKFVTTYDIIPSFRFSLAHTLNSNFSLGYNLGMAWEGGSYHPKYEYTITVAASLGEKFGIYVESFGDFCAGSYPESYCDFGTTYSPVNNIQFDLSSGVALNKNATDFYLSIGISFRLPR